MKKSENEVFLVLEVGYPVDEMLGNSWSFLGFLLGL